MSWKMKKGVKWGLFWLLWW